MEQQSKSSPYTSLPVALYIGPERKKYHVPRDLLQNPKWINTSSKGKKIALADVNEHTGHVLVHYLYTGAYQTLNDIDGSPVEEEEHVQFKRALQVYTVATTYELHALQHLARQKIKHFGAGMDIFDSIKAIKDDFAKLPSDATWLHEYLCGKAREAAEEDHTIFARKDLFGSIDNMALMRLLLNGVMDFYNYKITALGAEKVPVSKATENGFTDAVDVPVEESPAEEASAVKESPVKREEAPWGVDAAAAAQPAGDSWGFIAGTTSKKKKKKIGKKACWTEEPIPDEPTLAPEPEKMEEETDPWSVTIGGTKDKKEMMMHTALPAPELEPELQPEPVRDEYAWDGGWASSVIGKKTKKSKKKLVDNAVPVPELEPEVLPSIEVQPTVFSEPEDLPPIELEPTVFPSKKSKKKKGKITTADFDTPIEELVVEPASLSPEPELICEPAIILELEPVTVEEKATSWDDWGATPALTKKGKTVEQEKEALPEEFPSVQEPFTVEQPREEFEDDRGAVDPFAGLSKFQKKKLERKVKAEAKLKEEEQARKREEEEEEETHRQEAMYLQTEIGHSYPEVELEQSIEAESGMCSFRATHLLGDQWKSCKQCQALLRQVAIQLAHVRHPDEIEYEMVDRVLTQQMNG